MYFIQVIQLNSFITHFYCLKVPCIYFDNFREIEGGEVTCDEQARQKSKSPNIRKQQHNIK